MYKNPVTQKQHLAHFANAQALHSSLKRMHSLSTFSIVNLRKKMRPFFRTFSLGNGNEVLGLHLKHSNLSIRAYLVEQNEDGLCCFNLTSTKFGESFPFTIWVKNDKEFLQKVILDYNLFNIN